MIIRYPPPPVHTYNILLTIGSSGASLIYCPGKVLQTEKIAHVHVIGTMFGLHFLRIVTDGDVFAPFV